MFFPWWLSDKRSLERIRAVPRRERLKAAAIGVLISAAIIGGVALFEATW